MIDVIAQELGQLIHWPHCEVMKKNLPDSFKTTYPRTTCIIDCSEVFIKRGASFSASHTYNPRWNLYKLVLVTVHNK